MNLIMKCSDYLVKLEGIVKVYGFIWGLVKFSCQCFMEYSSQGGKLYGVYSLVFNFECVLYEVVLLIVSY